MGIKSFVQRLIVCALFVPTIAYAGITSEGQFTGKKIATPSNPASGYVSMYFKSDGLLYGLDSAGAETLIGGIPDAPSDGSTYGRKDAAWIALGGAGAETDPIWSAWATANDHHANWDSAYGWGNHASAGYLTSASSLDPSKVSQTASYRFVTDTEKSTWNGKQNAITTGTTAQYFKGDLSLGTFPTALSSFTNDLGNYGSFLTASSSLDPSKISQTASYRLVTDTEKSTWNGKQTALNGTGFVKASGTTISYDNSTYLTSLGTALVDADFGSAGLMKRGASSGVYSVVPDNSTNWDNAYGWGNHATAGYVTGTPWASMGYITAETDPVFGAWQSSYDHHANWDSAYGWGNHASAGYLTAETDPLSLHLTSVSPQTIIQTPIFSNGLDIQNSYSWSSGHVTYVPSGEDINDYIALASNGDTLVLGSGTFTDPITIDKSIAIVGMGVRATYLPHTTITHMNVDISKVAFSNGLEAHPVGSNDVITNINLQDISAIGSGTSSTKVYAIKFVDADVNMFHCEAQAYNTVGDATAIYVEITNNATSTSPAVDLYNVKAVSHAVTGSVSNVIEQYNSRTGPSASDHGLSANYYLCSFTSYTSDMDGENFALGNFAYLHGNSDNSASFIQSTMLGSYLLEDNGQISLSDSSILDMTSGLTNINANGLFYGALEVDGGITQDYTANVSSPIGINNTLHVDPSADDTGNTACATVSEIETVSTGAYAPPSIYANYFLADHNSPFDISEIVGTMGFVYNHSGYRATSMRGGYFYAELNTGTAGIIEGGYFQVGAVSGVADYGAGVIIDTPFIFTVGGGEITNNRGLQVNDQPGYSIYTGNGDIRFGDLAGAGGLVSVTTDGVLGLDTTVYLEDAPSDGSLYGRKDGAWSPVGGAGAETDPLSLHLDQSTPQTIDLGDDCTVGFGTLDAMPSSPGIAVFPTIEFTNNNLIGASTNSGGVRDFFGVFGDMPTFAIMQSLEDGYYTQLVNSDNSLLIGVGGSGALTTATAYSLGTNTAILWGGVNSDSSLSGFGIDKAAIIVGDNSSIPSIIFVNTDTGGFSLLAISPDIDGDDALTVLGPASFSKGGTGISTSLNLSNALIGENLVGDGNRIRFSNRHEHGLFGVSFDSGYLDVVVDDVGEYTYSSHLELSACDSGGTPSNGLKIYGDGLVVVQGKLNASNLPTSTSGLSSGDLWVDTTGGLNIVKRV